MPLSSAVALSKGMQGCVQCSAPVSDTENGFVLNDCNTINCAYYLIPLHFFPQSLAALWLTDILNVLWESPCSLAAQWPSVEASVPGSVCQSTAPIQPNLLPQLSAFLPKQTPHCHTGLHASPLHFPCVNERLAVHLRQKQAGESPINQYTPLSLCDATVAPLCFVL